jgi:hypothetical protein
MNTIQSKKLLYISPLSYKIPLYYSGLYSISNLENNTFYTLTFNDVILSFLSDSNGTIYINNQKESLPLNLLSNIEIRINSKIPFRLNPVGNYYQNGTIMNVDLTEYNAVTKTITPISRQILINNGSLNVIPSFNNEQNSRSLLGVGIF